MDKSSPVSKTIDAYIASYPLPVQEMLQRLRMVIHEEAPGAEEAIAYGIPTFRLKGKNLVHFGAFRTHIGFYPTPTGLEAFQADLAPYKQSKGTVQFPLGQPLPLDLVRKIVAHRVHEVERGPTS